MTRLRLLAVVVVLAILTISTGVVMAAPPQQAPDVTFSPTSVTVMEPGGTATYTVVYDTALTADVIMTVTSSHPTINAMVCRPLSRSRPAGPNWNMPQTVTVTAVDDDVDHVPNRMATIAHVVEGGTAALVTVTIVDNESVGLTITPTPLVLDEGAMQEVSVTLDSEPTAAVVVTMTGNNPDVVIDPATYTVAPAAWSTAVVFDVRALWDIDTAPDIDNLTVTALGGDYNLTHTVPVTINEDSSNEAVITTRAITVPERGTETYQVVLNADRPQGMLLSLRHQAIPICLSIRQASRLPQRTGVPSSHSR